MKIIIEDKNAKLSLECNDNVSNLEFVLLLQRLLAASGLTPAGFDFIAHYPGKIN